LSKTEHAQQNPPKVPELVKMISAHFVKKKIAEHAQYSLFFTSDHFL
jgi:hypothetical protein